ncbi:hypothetical protein [Actinomadura rugatobispora]|uniref:Uncharacterized protein n=1 Tax=Actinomadura rugatobispora TaxID=1994 RepID=A0ABW0ZU14_9ACTN|nr:hypothetical protein GCM10010200_093400 [Actinomadura rugatobispora]
MRSFSTTLAAFGLAASLVMAAPLAMAAGKPPDARPTRTPLGKSNFAIAMGGLRADSTANWVRLGQYTFSDDGTVSEQYWQWSQLTRTVRVSTGNAAAGCTERDCVVPTAAGWQSTEASLLLEGRYRVDGDRLHISWEDGQWEDWTLTSLAKGTLAGVELEGNSLGATHGFGNGSNVSWTTRVPAAKVAAADHTAFTHRYYLWKTAYSADTGYTPYIDHGDGEPFWVTHWTPCRDRRCLGAQTHAPDGTVRTMYYIAPAGTSVENRRDTLWHWRTNLADARGEICYTGNSHVKPMLQVIGDDGRFHGWVGVEASLNQTTQNGTADDDIGIFRITG